MPAPERPQEDPDQRASPSLARRLAWFVFLWLAGIATVGAVAGILRLWIG